MLYMLVWYDIHIKLVTFSKGFFVFYQLIPLNSLSAPIVNEKYIN